MSSNKRIREEDAQAPDFAAIIMLNQLLQDAVDSATGASAAVTRLVDFMEQHPIAASFGTPDEVAMNMLLTGLKKRGCKARKDRKNPGQYIVAPTIE